MENPKSKTAVIAGATGLVGEQLLKLLLSNPAYGRVIAIVRRHLDLTHEKLEQKVIDFNELSKAFDGLNADHGYCCLGTTIKTAGTKEKQYIIDHDYVLDFARCCHASGVKRFAVVSSIGANSGSSNFYLRTKGEMERDIQMIPFKSIFILQPSFLLGDRKELRTGEKTAIAIMNVLNPFMIGGLKKFRGVQVADVAQCMIRQVLSPEQGLKILKSDEIK